MYCTFSRGEYLEETDKMQRLVFTKYFKGVLVNTKKGVKLGYNMGTEDIYFQYTTVCFDKKFTSR